MKGASEHKYCGLPTARVTLTSNFKSNVPPWNLPISPSARTVRMSHFSFSLAGSRAHVSGRHAYLPWHKDSPRPDGTQSRSVFSFQFSYFIFETARGSL